MFVVIFKARIKTLDQAYFQTAKQLRQLALEKYGCVDFISLTEGDQEIALSYWQNQADIRAWKQDPLHLQAQAQGQSRWYASYTVEIASIERQYQQPAQDTGDG